MGIAPAWLLLATLVGLASCATASTRSLRLHDEKPFLSTTTLAFANAALVIVAAAQATFVILRRRKKFRVVPPPALGGAGQRPFPCRACGKPVVAPGAALHRYTCPHCNTMGVA